MIAVVSVLVVVALSLLLTRIGTVALMLTGLSRDAASFQARSAFYGAGFTTAESELVVSHPLRRRIIMLLILLGNAGVVTAIASLILSFLDPGSASQGAFRLGILLAGLLGLCLLASSEVADRWLSKAIKLGLQRFTNLDVRDYTDLLHLSGDWVVSELVIEDGEWLAHQPLAALQLPDEGVVVLGLERAKGGYIGAPTGDTLLVPGDTVLLYGQHERLTEIHHRRRGPSGDKAHILSVATHRREIIEQREQDRANTLR